MSASNTVAEPVTKHKYLALSIYCAISSKAFGQVLLQTPRAHDTPLLAFGALPEPLELTGELSYLPVG